MLSDKTLRLNPREQMITPFILSTLLSASVVRLQIGTLLNGSSGQKNISQKQLRSILIPVPSIQEQQVAEGYLRKSVQHIASEVRRLRKLHSLKTALMQDLLTGKKRVTPLLEPEAAY
jgi:type I restriction enzyme S subunit